MSDNKCNECNATGEVWYWDCVGLCGNPDYDPMKDDYNCGCNYRACEPCECEFGRNKCQDCTSTGWNQKTVNYCHCEFGHIAEEFMDDCYDYPLCDVL